MSMTADPHPYQAEALARFMERGNMLLAFDTGIGKTYTAIAIGEELLETRQARRVLVCVPASLKFQWAKALARFTDLPQTEILIKGERAVIPDPSACIIIDGTPERRARLYKAAQQPGVQYVILGYDQLAEEWRQVRRLRCEYLVMDEASAIKNPGSKRSKSVKRHFGDVPWRLALTATPIENRPEEVFSIMEWVDPAVLGRYDLFDRSYIVRDPWGNVSRYKHLDVLHEKLSPAMVRKTRHDPDVAPFMPDVDDGVWEVALDEGTWRAYRAMLADLLAAYGDIGSFGTFNVDAHYGQARDDPRGDKTALGRLMGIHETMQMLLNHPLLVAESARLYLTTDDRGSRYAAQLMEGGFELPAATPKLDDLADRCSLILDEDPDAKILIFTRSKLMLRLIRDRLDPAGQGSVIYDGDMTSREKEAAVTRFASAPGVRLFLSSHAGAYGTDMPWANWLANYDIPWGAGLARQINGRHVRASSAFAVVHVRDLVCLGTIEERKWEQKGFKNAISAGVIDGQTGETGELASDVDSLKRHAEGVLAIDKQT
jgi:SNF2 family DNA or RNA helicase